MRGVISLTQGAAGENRSAETDVDIGVGAAAAMRRRSVWLRLALMGGIALLLGWVGGWPWAALWWPAYAAMQAVVHQAERLRMRIGDRPLYAASFISFAIAGAPAWHLWEHNGVLGAAAASLYLTGMLAQLVASSLAARKLFLASAAPLCVYMLTAPTLAFLPERPIEAFSIVACSAMLIVYLGVLWHGQQAIFEKVRVSREAAHGASRAKGDFLAMMSHEIRTPMNAVLGSADLLARTDLTPEQAEHLEVLRAGGAALMDVLNDVLDFSKIEAGRMTVAPVTTDMHELVQRWAGLWCRAAEDRGLAFQVEIAEEAPRYVAIDPARTGQIVANLLSNAVKFTASGAITLSVEGEAAEGGGCELRISVSDTGIGMAPATVMRLFTPFEQADGSITRRFGGTGLGLSIGQKLAGMMGGEIVVRSVEGQGSRFTLRLPAAVCAAPERAKPDAPAEPADGDVGSLRILVAEDHPANQRIIDHFLRPLGASVTIVGDGAEALAALREQPFDVVLMDVHMPVMDGLQATRAVRAEAGPNRTTPILALTASALDSDRDACLEAGMTAHVAKPIDPRVLLSTLLAMAQQRDVAPRPTRVRRSRGPDGRRPAVAGPGSPSRSG